MKEGVDIKGGDRGGCLATPFTEISWVPPFESLRLSFCIVLLKRLLITPRATFKKLWSKSYVFQNKAKICVNVPQGPPQQLNCVDKNKWKSNDFKHFTM